MTILYANNAVSTLAGAINNTATTAALASGTGVLFPAPVAGQFFCMTFSDALTGLNREIVHVTNVTGDVITIVRAQEGTTAQNWLAGDLALNLFTTGTLNQFLQVGQSQLQAGNFGADAGTANAPAISLNPPVTALASIVGMPIRILKIAAANTGACTLTVNGLTANLVHPGNIPLIAGELPASGIFNCAFDGATFELQNSYPLGMNNGGLVGKVPLGNAPVNLLVAQVTPGTYSFTVPAFTFSLFLVCQGAGGGGAGANSATTSSGGAGGAGGYAMGWVAVNPGDVIAYTVGTGGTAGPHGTSGTDGTNGTSSSIGSFMSATGGMGGKSVANAAGGQGGLGTVTGSGFGTYGGHGGDGSVASQNNVAGNGGASFFGGGTRGATSGNMITAAEGSGGGGGYQSTGDGSPGLPGAVLIYG